jgi:hypothetical protein
MIEPQAGIACVYTYHDANGAPKYEVVRYIPKRFNQRQVDGHGGHTWSMDGVERVPFDLPRLLKGKAAGHSIFLTEGEKDAESLEGLGFCATTNAGGSPWQFTPEFIEHFRGAKRIVVLPDCDTPGRKAAVERAVLLSAVCADVRIVDLAPKRSDKFDVSDWLADGGTVEQLKALVESTPPFTSQGAPSSPADTEGGSYLSVTRADHIKIERIEWLCEQRVPFCGITLFDGPGGIGKTTFLTGIIAALSNGRDFFTGAEIEPVNCLIVGVEDARELIAARLKLYGADLTRIHLVDATFIAGKAMPLELPGHVGILERKIIDLEIGFVYIDALFSHIALDGEGRMAQQVRAALQPIGEMCARQKVAFGAMRHWAKATGSALSRALGSVEFTNFARSVFTFGQHPGDADLVVCSHTKSNYARLTGAVAFKRTAHKVADDNGAEWEVAIADAVAACEGVTSDDLTMRTPGDPDDKDVAAEWLRDHLGDGLPQFARSVQEAADKARVGSKSTLLRAARSIGVVMDRTKDFPSVGTWQLVSPVDSQSQLRHVMGDVTVTPLDFSDQSRQSRHSHAYTMADATEATRDEAALDL